MPTMNAAILGTMSASERNAIRVAQQPYQSAAVKSRSGMELPVVDTPWRLTPMQVQVMKFICEGMCSKQIGPLLGTSPKTVEVHRSRILEKMGIHGNTLRAAVLFDRFMRAQEAANDSTGHAPPQTAHGERQ
jgi:DNA-binding NarL/FixJ family response regulator